MSPTAKIELRRLIRFAIVGTLNTAACYAVYASLVYWRSWHHDLALVADYSLGTLLGFVLHRLATFGDRKQVKLAFRKYLATLAMAFALNFVILDALVRFSALGPLAGQAAAIGLV